MKSHLVQYSWSVLRPLHLSSNVDNFLFGLKGTRYAGGMKTVALQTREGILV